MPAHCRTPDMPAGQIYHCKLPQLPQFRFEWHPGKRAVYLIRIGVMPEHGERIADAATIGEGRLAILLWCQGYLARVHETALGAPAVVVP